MNSSDVNIKAYKLYKTRWLFLATVAWTNMVCMMIGVSFSPVATLGKLLYSKVLVASTQFTRLQKHSKCEVKVWLCWNLIILPPLQFYVKLNFGEYKRSKNVIFGKFRASGLWILVNLVLESCSNLLKSKFRTSKIAKNDILDGLN